MEQFKVKSSSWREENIRIKSHSLYTMTFLDTKPNMFYIQNPNATKLHVSISKIPTSESYEFSVAENSSKALGRPTGTMYLYIYNDGNIDAEIKVFSINDTFDLSLLESISLNVEGITVDVEEQQEIKGFSDGVMLPSGNNIIGKVGFDATELDNIRKIESNTSTAKTNLSTIYTDLTGRNKKGVLFQILEALSNVQIDGDVFVNFDNLYKENVIESKAMAVMRKFDYITEYADNEYIKIFNGVSFNVDYSKMIESQTNDNISITVTNSFYNSSSGTYDINIFLKSSIVGSSASYSFTEAYIEGNYAYVKVNELKFFMNDWIEDGYGVTIIGFNQSMGSLQDDTFVLKNIEYKNISGLLYDCKRIKKCEFAGTYTMDSMETKSVYNKASTESQPLKIFDEISKMFTVDDSQIIVKIYYTFTDYYTVTIGKGNSITDLKHSIYKIEFVNDKDKITEVCILGGTY